MQKKEVLESLAEEERMKIIKKNTEPFWYKLIAEHIINKNINIEFGLTVPYIIGAKTLVNDQFTINKHSVN